MEDKWDSRGFYEWLCRKENLKEGDFGYQELLDCSYNMGIWFDEIQPLYEEYLEQRRA